MAIDIKLFQKIILENKSFILTTHVNPDGDAIGSVIAMANFLLQMGKNVSIINCSETPKNYIFLDKEKKIENYETSLDKKILSCDVIMVLDTNSGSRLKSMENIVKTSTAKKIIIDHHLDEENFCDFYFTDTSLASTGEIVYNLISSMTEKFDFNESISTSLYTAIMTDTGSFRYPRTTDKTFFIAADLISKGASPTSTYENVYENWSLGKISLLGKMLSQIKFFCENKIAISFCSKQNFIETNTNEIATDGFTGYLMSIENIKIGILINELNDGVKISFRSKGEIAVNEFAKKFAGGGHKNASGARVFDIRLDEFLPKLISEIENFYNNKL